MTKTLATQCRPGRRERRRKPWSLRPAARVLAAGFGFGAAVVCRGIGRAVGLPTALAAMSVQAIGRAARPVFVVPGGAVVPVRRIAADRPCRAGRKEHLGMNVPALTDPFGRLPRACPALPGPP
ncbi:hypothetical protein OG698_48610 (plasmid) [Streptomyces sp. NBC_01003]|uniref:hypothetical protein n=1 Tax=Streptomyces sp. NBC_01003 TaxID=2903714 RepID=UPI002F917803|nr:hypothetical protein OG698_48610 [Streptomyces sp. NBC_01003]